MNEKFLKELTPTPNPKKGNWRFKKRKLPQDILNISFKEMVWLTKIMSRFILKSFRA